MPIDTTPPPAIICLDRVPSDVCKNWSQDTLTEADRQRQDDCMQIQPLWARERICPYQEYWPVIPVKPESSK
jgi:hypothetical protein